MTGTLRYVTQRALLIVFTALAVSSIVFLGIHRLPGDAFVSERLRPSQQAALLHQYGLDRPLLVQYRDFVAGVLHGDLGESVQHRGTRITPLVLREAVVSLEVGGVALVFTIGLGLAFGVVGAVRHNTWVDYLLGATSVVGYSMPNFVLATVLLLVFGVWLERATGGAVFYEVGWTGQYGTPAEILVPAFALGFPLSAFVARLTRASMLEVIRQDFVRTARAKGLAERLVVVRHALRNALIPVITVLAPLVIGVITGSVVIENIFGIPGLGKEFTLSILNRDYNITIGVFTAYAAMVGVANLAVDLVYPLIDPRIRY
jgi:oligopeptide transport system permease protein